MEFKLEHTEAAMKLADTTSATTTSAATSMFMDSAEKIHTKVFSFFSLLLSEAHLTLIYLLIFQKKVVPRNF